MKKLSLTGLLALALAAAASIPALADTTPVPTKPPGNGMQAGSVPVLILADTTPVPVQPPTKTNPPAIVQAGSISVA